MKAISMVLLSAFIALNLTVTPIQTASANQLTQTDLNSDDYADLVVGVPDDDVSTSFSIFLWPDGSVPYHFDIGSNDGTHYTIPFSTHDKNRIRAQMDVWETALQIANPNGRSTRKYIRFWECTDDDALDENDCPPTGYVLVRYNKIRVTDNEPAETNNMCTYFEGGEEKVGRNPGGKTEYHLTQKRDKGTGAYLDTQQPDRIILHELGHCLGLWHEFNRSDADRWLQESPDVDGDDSVTAFGTRAGLLPNLGNYNYDSILGYGSHAPLPSSDHLMVNEFKDRVEGGNIIDKEAQGAIISPRDISRVLQYYAHERYSGWSFFTSLSTTPGDPDALPNPNLAQGVQPVGTPAIAFQSPGNFDIFARGSDDQLYWKSYRRRILEPNPDRRWPKPIIKDIETNWRSIGSGFRSDPSAVSRGSDRIDVVAVNTRGDVQRIKYIDGNWYDPLTIRGGHPSGGIKESIDSGYIGPTIASRGVDSLDVFIVRTDGLLAVTTWSSSNWGMWRTLGQGYDVTARPAATALSATEVQLAINERNFRLYEPIATFSPAIESFDLGTIKGTTAFQAPPALTKRSGQVSRYRVLIVNAAGRISHRTEFGDWIDIGGIPKPGTGPSTVATGDFMFKAVMNGEDATGCDLSCAPPRWEGGILKTYAPRPNGAFIQPGGLWIRDFD